MSRGAMLAAVPLAFAIGFGGFLVFHARTNDIPLAAVFVPNVVCDDAEALCRSRKRAQADLYFKAGDEGRGVAVLRRLARGGDLPAMFHLGWHHEEVYRAAVGRALEAGKAIPEEATFGPSGLPSGEAFEALVDARSAARDEARRRDDARALAFLWYAKAAAGGFAPAANNLASMYQFGLIGHRDQRAARRWYLAAYDAGSPVAAFNLETLRIHGYDDPDIDCMDHQGPGWLPLTQAPAEVDMTDPTLTRTRFRGRAVGANLKILLRDMALRVSDPEAWMRAAVAKPLEDRFPKFGGDDWDFDDEDPATRNHVPTFEEAQARSAERDARNRSCESNARSDPRADRISRQQAIQFEQMQRLQDLRRPGGGLRGAS